MSITGAFEKLSILNQRCQTPIKWINFTFKYISNEIFNLKNNQEIVFFKDLKTMLYKLFRKTVVQMCVSHIIVLILF